jgi:hypothetical protein
MMRERIKEICEHMHPDGSGAVRDGFTMDYCEICNETW